MSKFLEFKEAFNKDYSIYDVMWRVEDGGFMPFGMVLEQNQDVEAYDSYGNEDSELSRVFRVKEFGDIYVRFYGTRCSYQGEEWDGFIEVKPQEKIIKIWEDVN
jgi:hypothetical protein